MIARMNAICVWGAVMLAAGISRSQDVTSYIDIKPGTLPIILTAPHGGTLKPLAIADRSFGKVMVDANTAALTELIADALAKDYGARPHMVKCLLHRSKVDCNREVEEAAQGDPLAVAAWKRYHSAADLMVQQVIKRHGSGLLLDIHGHRHEERRIELGYLISGAELNRGDAILAEDADLPAKTSIRDLDKRSPETLVELVRGPSSLGGLLEKRGLRVVPSPRQPGPGKGMYFSGAYDVTAHGSRDGGTVSAIQIECPWEGVRDKPENQLRFAKALADALGEFFKIHFGKELGGPAQ